MGERSNKRREWYLDVVLEEEEVHLTALPPPPVPHDYVCMYLLRCAINRPGQKKSKASVL